MSAGEWGYSKANGPEKWHEKFPLAKGHRQSPVDIITSKTNQSNHLSSNPLRWNYGSSNMKSLINPGYCWRVDVTGNDCELLGGPLGKDKFILEQFHCHWGCSDGKGSEHTVDGKSYSGELHLVHWNQTKYKSFGEAAQNPDGLAVLGVFLQVGDHHPEMDKIANLLPLISHKGDRVTLKEHLDPALLLPKNTAYWTYDGSLTTPPLTESVIWIVFKEPVQVSRNQLDNFRQLRCYDIKEECPCDELNGRVINNYRPPLPLGNRELRDFGGH